MSKTNLVFKPLNKKPQRKKMPFVSSSVKKKKDASMAEISAKKPKKAAPKVAVGGKNKDVSGKNILETQKAKIQAVATKQRTHESADKKVEETQKSVSVAPSLQKSSKAKSNQVEDMASQKTKKFDSAKFTKDILDNIKKVIPKKQRRTRKRSNFFR